MTEKPIVLVSLCAGLALSVAAPDAGAQQGTPQAPVYVETGRDFRQTEQVTMGRSLLTPEEEARFATLRQQAKTRAEMDRFEAKFSTLLNLRVNERITKALSEPVSAPPQ